MQDCMRESNQCLCTTMDHGQNCETSSWYVHTKIHYTVYRTNDHCLDGINMLRHRESHLACLGALANGSYKSHGIHNLPSCCDQRSAQNKVCKLKDYDVL